ncbi:MAG: N-6 DNA methylase, partial [Chloroflexi bacterium]|nr:N-6 DNA methylase [Chloroflexota bacterium]
MRLKIVAWSAPQEAARRKIGALVEQYKRIPPEQRKGITEDGVVHQFLDPFFEALGWPIRDPDRYKYQLSTQAGRPDMTLIPEQGGAIFVEAKRFGAIKELKESRKTLAGIVTPGQLALPGMATDRTPQEQQAINYAFQNGSAWAILANFEKLRLFNARRDWLVLSFETPDAYLEQFEWLWALAYDSVVGGRLDELSNLRHRADVDTAYLAFINEWRERLARDILDRPADNWWAFDDDGRILLAELRAVVQRVLDRLVVIRFAEDHLITPAGTLFSLYELRRSNPYTFTLSQFLQQLFRRFDEDHNSALFAFDLADEAVFSDAVLAALVEKLYEARYRAMSADIMGNTYEQYLGKTLVQVNGQVRTADNLETRKKQGSYYTPQVIVRYLVDKSLGRYLYGTAGGRPDGEPLPGERPKTAAEIRDLRLIDPACGSGSFLIYAYEVLAGFYRREIRRLEAGREQRLQELGAQTGMTPFDLRLELTPLTAEIERLQGFPHLILENHLYGVDLDPQAAEIATVNLIMRAMVDQPVSEKQLPLILNQNVKVGNSLIGAGPGDERYTAWAAELAGLRRLRLQLAAATRGVEHEQIVKEITAVANRVRAALNEGLAPYFEDLDAVRPFHWLVEFPEVFVDENGRPKGEAAGFDVVIGNPPWEIVKPDLREYYAQFDPDIESRLNRQQVEARIEQLNFQDPRIEAGWAAQKARIEATAAYLRRPADFTRQGKGDTATHKLFLERGYNLLRREGRLAFVIPSGVYTDLGTKELREMLLNEGQIQYLFNFSNERFFFPYVDHRFKFTLLGAQKGQPSDGFWATFRFNPRVAVAPEELPAFLANEANLVYIEVDSLARFSPGSLSVMEFQTQRDYVVAEKIYGENPLFGEESDWWGVKLNNEFHFTNDRHLLNQRGDGLPFYEGKMIHQYDAFYAPPQFWISKERIAELPPDKQEQLKSYRVVHRRIAATTNERTLIAAIVPPNTACEVNATVVLIQGSDNGQTKLYVCSLLNSYVLDYIIRYKISTTLNMFYIYQLPAPRLAAGNPYFDAIVPRAARLTCTRPEFAGLWQEVIGQAWDETGGATDQSERARLRAELDGLVAHLYGLSEDDFRHILSTFP